MPTSSARIGLSTTSEPALVVADASVLVELVIDGRHRRGADAVLASWARTPRTTLLTAAHGLIEAVSAIRRLARHDALSPEDGRAALRWLADLDLVLDATAPRLARIWSLRDRMSACDAAYAAAAEAFETPLLTADRRLLRACDDAGIPARHLDELAESGG